MSKEKYIDIITALRAEVKTKSGELLLQYADGHRQIRGYQNKVNLKRILIELYLEHNDYLMGFRYPCNTVTKVLDAGNHIRCDFNLMTPDLDGDAFTKELFKEFTKWKRKDN